MSNELAFYMGTLFGLLMSATIVLIIAMWEDMVDYVDGLLDLIHQEYIWQRHVMRQRKARVRAMWAAARGHIKYQRRGGLRFLKVGRLSIQWSIAKRGVSRTQERKAQAMMLRDVERQAIRAYRQRHDNHMHAN